MPKLKVGILFGGRSAEHEVSIVSARNIVSALDPAKYEPVLIGIAKDGRWLRTRDASGLLGASNGRLKTLNAASGEPVTLAPMHGGAIVPIEGGGTKFCVDVVFPVLHGPFGEDGTVQGFLKLAGVPFVGAGVLSSAVGMDKDVMKRLLREAGIPTARFAVFRSGGQKPVFREVVKSLGSPVFVKPANMGSSVGIAKASNEADFDRAVAEAFAYDTKILVEETIRGRELECSVLGNLDPVASVPGEVIPRLGFYSYDAKYVDENAARLEIPAKLPPDTALRVRETAIAVFKALCCEGMGRVDFFLKDDGSLVVNEINTIPGFTSISMYPKLFEASGVPYNELIDRLIRLALERHEREKGLKTEYGGRAIS